MKKKFETIEDASRIYLLPNFFTASNLFFGFSAIIRCIQAKYTAITPSMAHLYYTQAVWLVLFAALADALDGRVARLGKRESLFGMEFDSIADMVSFGVAPALMVFFLILSPTEGLTIFRQIGWLIGFVYLLCAGIRLARFNVITHPLLPQDELRKSSKDFLGLPVPAAAGAIVSIVMIINSYELSNGFLITLPPLMLLIAYLMVSTIPFPSFKKVDWNTKTKLNTFIIGIAIIAIVVWFHEFSMAIIFLSYMFFGVARHISKVKRSHNDYQNDITYNDGEE
ncbi:MAG: CDP-diacylglycerol--serine O-phosphatidyltransferase [Puniceicoccales bacterium]|jgi:CDP-diacylglycerol--serine O-phosphatidyltransferase|nr:CDP-diacylglycerol--serine O-phosphatidyltransferase [Puniceicoccales bacterium]